jgi:hypothetical protein
MIQIDEVSRQLFIKLIDNEKIMAIFRETDGQVDYKYPTGELFQMTVVLAGMGTNRVRIANLPPEVPNDVLRDALTRYWKVLDVRIDSWSKAYRGAVFNGIRRATVLLTKHARSHLTVAGYRVLLSYDGQPATCYGCGNAGHMFQEFPTR